jgi:hypothetical protein
MLTLPACCQKLCVVILKCVDGCGKGIERSDFCNILILVVELLLYAAVGAGKEEIAALQLCCAAYEILA